MAAAALVWAAPPESPPNEDQAYPPVKMLFADQPHPRYTQIVPKMALRWPSGRSCFLQHARARGATRKKNFRFRRERFFLFGGFGLRKEREENVCLKFWVQLGCTALSWPAESGSLRHVQVHLILCCPYEQSVEEGVNGIFLDMGTVLTAICLAAHAHGLGAKPQFSVAKYHDVCREVISKAELPDDMLVVCGLSIGWPADGRDPRTQPDFFPTRLSVDETTRWACCDPQWVAAGEGAGGDGQDPGLLALIQSRHGSHSLDPALPVPKDVIAAILAAARNVPSTNNSQPWCVTVIQGEARDRLSQRMLEVLAQGFA